jgi:hypothetical protein
LLFPTPLTRLLVGAATVFALQPAAFAQAASNDRCRAYADSQVALATRADPKACPAFKSRASNWDGHFDWCLRNSRARVDQEDEIWGSKFDGCMSSVEAAKTEKALADADRKAKATASVGSYDERWNKGLRRMADMGMTKPFHRNGYEFQAFSTEAKRWGAGLQKDQQLGFYAVCDTCKGITVRLRDASGKVIAQEQTAGSAVELMAYPTSTGKGSVEFTVTNCQTRDDSCKLRYTSFSL